MPNFYKLKLCTRGLNSAYRETVVLLGYVCSIVQKRGKKHVLHYDHKPGGVFLILRKDVVMKGIKMLSGSSLGGPSKGR